MIGTGKPKNAKLSALAKLNYQPFTSKLTGHYQPGDDGLTKWIICYFCPRPVIWHATSFIIIVHFKNEDGQISRGGGPLSQQPADFEKTDYTSSCAII